MAVPAQNEITTWTSAREAAAVVTIPDDTTNVSEGIQKASENGAELKSAGRATEKPRITRPAAQFSERELAARWGIEELGESCNERRVTRRTRRRALSESCVLTDAFSNTTNGGRATPTDDLEIGVSTTTGLVAPPNSLASSPEHSPIEKASPPMNSPDWQVVHTRTTAPASTGSILDVRPRFFMPDWFELSEDRSGELGPIPGAWLDSVNAKRDTASFKDTFEHELDTYDFEEFLPAIDSDEEVDQLLSSITESLQPHTRAMLRDDAETSTSVNAVVVEVVDEDKESTKHDKGKGVDPGERGPHYRDFLRKYASARPTSSRLATLTAETRRTQSPALPRHLLRQEPVARPAGGWFRATTEPPELLTDAAGGNGGGPPSTSSSSSESASDDSSSDSSDDWSSSLSSSSAPPSSREERERNRRRRKKKEAKRVKRAMHGVKLKQPSTWDGRADLDVFDKWTYEVDTWAELSGLDDQLLLKVVVNFMSGKASNYFMKHVSTRQRDWTVKLLYESLFNYCFPDDYKERLRDRFLHAT